MKVKNMRSSSGNKVANQFIITDNHNNEFLGEGIAETRKKIKSGEYRLVDLNEN